MLKAAGTHLGPTKLPAEKDGGPSGNKPKSERWRAGKKKTIQARINTGLKRGQKTEDAEEAKTKTGQGKENVPKKQPQMVRDMGLILNIHMLKIRKHVVTQKKK